MCLNQQRKLEGDWGKEKIRWESLRREHEFWGNSPAFSYTNISYLNNLMIDDVNALLEYMCEIHHHWTLSPNSFVFHVHICRIEILLFRDSFQREQTLSISQWGTPRYQRQVSHWTSAMITHASMKHCHWVYQSSSYHLCIITHIYASLYVAVNE